MVFGFKRKYASPQSGRRNRRKYGSKVTKSKSFRRRGRRTKFARNVMRVVNQRAETKEVMIAVCNNFTLQHNTVTNLYQNAFYSKIGTPGEQTGTGNSGSRIGGRLFCKGIKVSLMIEAQQYRPLTQYWLYLIKPKTDLANTIDTKPKMFEGVTSTIPCDYIDQDQVHILACKKFTLRAPNVGTANSVNTAVIADPEDGPDGTFWQIDAANSNETVMTNAQKLTKFYIPINKQINYQDFAGGDPTLPTSMRYQWVMIAYDNYSSITGGGGLPTTTNYPVGHVTMSTKMVFTDV